MRSPAAQPFRRGLKSQVQQRGNHEVSSARHAQLRWGNEARGARRQGARSSSPNDVRLEEGWLASTDPTANSIEPPAAGGKPAQQEGSDTSKPSPAPAADDADKVACLDEHRQAADRSLRHRTGG